MVAPVVTFDGTGNPYVEVFFDPDEFDADIAYIQVWRYSENREWQVRGGVNIVPGVAALDFEAPPGEQSTYRAQMFSALGAPAGWTDATAIDVPDFGVAMHNPLDPTRYLVLPTISVLDEVVNTNTRPTVSDLVYTEGRSVGITIGTRRRGIVGLRFGVALTSSDDADLLQSMIGDYENQQIPVLCIRTPKPIRIPRTAFLRVDDPSEEDINTRWGGNDIRVHFTGSETAPPFPGLAVPLLTYDDLDVAYTTYDERDAAYASYTDQDRDYSLAGLAG